MLTRRQDGSIVGWVRGEERALVDKNNKIDEAIFNEIFPNFDQVTGKSVTVYLMLYSYHCSGTDTHSSSTSNACKFGMVFISLTASIFL